MRVIYAVAVLVFVFCCCTLIAQAETLKGVDISHSTLGPLTPPKNSDEAEKKKEIALDVLNRKHDTVGGFEAAAKFDTTHSRGYGAAAVPWAKGEVDAEDIHEHCRLAYNNGKYRFEYRRYLAKNNVPEEFLIGVYDGSRSYLYLPHESTGVISSGKNKYVEVLIANTFSAYLVLPHLPGFFSNIALSAKTSYVGEQPVNGRMCMTIKVEHSKHKKMLYWIRGNHVVRAQPVYRNTGGVIIVYDLTSFNSAGFPTEGRHVLARPKAEKPWAKVTDWLVVSYTSGVNKSLFSPIEFPVDTFVTDRTGKAITSYYVGGLKKHE